MPTSPADQDAAVTAGPQLRILRRDVKEFFAALGVDLDTDPCVDYTTALWKRVHWTEFTHYDGGGSASVLTSSGYATVYRSAAGTLTLYAPLLLPRGVTVTELVVVGRVIGSDTITLTLESSDATTATVGHTTHATAALTSATDLTTASSGAISVVLDDTSTNYIYYYLKLTQVQAGTGNTGTGFGGAMVKYTRGGIDNVI